MRKLIKQQLEKVEYADLSNLNEKEAFIIPKRAKSAFEIGKEYIIELAPDLLIKGANDILECNYNGGRVPQNKYLHGEVESVFGKVVFFSGCGYDNSDLNTFWRGYLPKDKIKIIKRL